MKWMRYILIAVVAAFTLSACSTDPEDAFSTAPVAPELDPHGDILITANTIDENVVFTWKAARFLGNGLEYNLTAKYGASPVVLGTTSETSITFSKTEFKKVLYDNIKDLPQNASFSLEFIVTAVGNKQASNALASESISVKIYAFGDAVVPVFSTEIAKVHIFTPEEMDSTLELLVWDAARLGYNEQVTYSVQISHGEGAPVVVGDKLTTLAITKTIDEWNDLVVATGVTEGLAADIKCVVFAHSESIPAGVPSEPLVINITTYNASYPAKIYVPGNYNGWDPAKESTTIPMSSLVKGLYDSYLDMTGTDAETEFKFAPDPSWANAYTSNDYVVSTDDQGNTVVSGTLIQGEGTANMKVPAGLYRVAANLKLKKFEMVMIKSMGMIGDASPGGWDADSPLVYDGAKNEYTATLNMLKDKSYKFRANGNWAWSVGDTNELSGSGGNITFDKDDGEYKVVLNVSKHPYTITFSSTSFPEKLYLPGAHQGWSPATAPTLMGNGAGMYEGGVSLVDGDGGANCQFKFAPEPSWGKDFGGVLALQGDIYKGNYGGGDNFEVPSSYYYLTVNMTTTEVTALPISKVGLIGDFNGWGGDAEFSYANGKWTLSGQALKANQGFKVRFNGGWDHNRGAGGDVEPATIPVGTATSVYGNGKNMTVAADGDYNLVLDMVAVPNTLTITKN